jgi:phosphoribosylanthranilate isomerase
MPETLAKAELPFVIKVCGITHERDLETSIQAGSNAIGFNFYSKSPRFLTPARARLIVQSVPGQYLKVGVFVNPTEDELLRAASLVPLDVLQLHGEWPANLASSFRIWQSASAGMSHHALDPNIEALLLDTPTPQYGGSGRTFDWSLAVGAPRRVIVAGGLDASNVATAIRIAHPWGVDACSRLELEPGQKDPLRIKLFVETALLAFRSQPDLKQHLELHQ